MQYNKTYITLC